MAKKTNLQQVNLYERQEYISIVQNLIFDFFKKDTSYLTAKICD